MKFWVTIRRVNFKFLNLDLDLRQNHNCHRDSNACYSKSKDALELLYKTEWSLELSLSIWILTWEFTVFYTVRLWDHIQYKQDFSILRISNSRSRISKLYSQTWFIFYKSVPKNVRMAQSDIWSIFFLRLKIISESIKFSKTLGKILYEMN